MGLSESKVCWVNNRFITDLQVPWYDPEPSDFERISGPISSGRSRVDDHLTAIVWYLGGAIKDGPI
jgi:hypothetical protein